MKFDHTKIKAGIETWKGFYSIAPGDKFEKILTATLKTYSLNKKVNGKKDEPKK